MRAGTHPSVEAVDGDVRVRVHRMVDTSGPILRFQLWNEGGYLTYDLPDYVPLDTIEEVFRDLMQAIR